MNSSKNILDSTVTNLIPDHIADIIFFVTYASFGQAVNIFGIITNTISIVIFLRLGFKDTVNISLLGLTISDFFSLLTLLFFNICQTPAFYQLDLPFIPYDVAFITVGWSHVGFTRVTCGLTAFIALERCLCIAAPLKVKSILTSRRVLLIVVIMFPLLYASVLPIYFTASLTWVFSPRRNRSVLTMTYNDERDFMERISSIVNNVVPMSTFAIIVVCVTITIIQLRAKTKWRLTVAQAGGNNSVSDKETKVVKMVVFISAIFILFYLPCEVVFLWMIFDPEMAFDGRKSNVFKVSVSVLYLCEAINASVNVFVYLKMSSNYRKVFCNTFLRCTFKKTGNHHCRK